MLHSNKATAIWRITLALAVFCFTALALTNPLPAKSSSTPELLTMTMTLEAPVQSGGIYYMMPYYATGGGWCNNGSSGEWSVQVAVYWHWANHPLGVTWGGPDGKMHTPGDNGFYGWIEEVNGLYDGTGDPEGIVGYISPDGKTITVNIPLDMIGNPAGPMIVGFGASDTTSSIKDYFGPVGGGCANDNYLHVADAGLPGFYEADDTDAHSPGYADITHVSVVLKLVTSPGFEPPMADGPVRVKKNRVLPLKARLYDLSGWELTDLDIEPPILQVMYSASQGGVSADVTDWSIPAGLGTEGNEFEYVGGHWQYNLKTKDFTAARTYQVTMVTNGSYAILIDPAFFVIQ